MFLIVKQERKRVGLQIDKAFSFLLAIHVMSNHY